MWLPKTWNTLPNQNGKNLGLTLEIDISYFLKCKNISNIENKIEDKLNSSISSQSSFLSDNNVSKEMNQSLIEYNKTKDSTRTLNIPNSSPQH